MMKIKRSSLLALVASLTAGVGLLTAGGVLANKDPVEAKAATGDVYQLVTNVSQLTEGDTVIFTNKKDQYVLSTVPSGGYATAAAISATGDKIIIENNTVAQEMLVGTVGNAFTFQFENGTFASLNNSANKLHTSTKSDSKNAQWTVKVNEDEAVVTNAQYTDRMLQFNNSANPKRFLCYKSSSNQQNIHIWEKTVVETISEITIDVTNFQNQYEEGQTSWITDGIVVKDANGNELDHADVTFVFSDAEGNEYTTPNALATKVTATYTGPGASDPAPSASADITVTVTARVLTGFTLDDTGMKKDYVLNDQLDYSGLKIYLTYDVGENSLLEDWSEVTFDPADKTVLSDPTLTEVSVKYGDFPEQTIAITVANLVKGSYRFVTYSGSSNHQEGDIVIDEGSSGSHATWTPEQPCHVILEQKSNGGTPIRIKLDDEFRIYAKHTIDIIPQAGVTITAVSWQDTSENYALSSAGWSHATVTGTSLEPVDGTQTVSYTNSSGSQNRVEWFKVDYLAPAAAPFGEIKSLEIDKEAAKTNFRTGEKFTSEGLGIVGVDANGNKKALAPEEYTLSLEEGHLFTEEDIGSHTVTITLAAKPEITVSYTINVVLGPAYEFVFNERTIKADGVIKLEGQIGSLAWDVQSGGVNTGYDTNRGQQFQGRSSEVSLRSEIFSNGDRVAITSINVNAAKAGDKGATLTVGIGGTELGSYELTGQATDYEFKVSTPMTGHIEIDLSRVDTSKSLYIKSIAVTADLVEGGEAAIDLAKRVETVDSCGDTASFMDLVDEWMMLDTPASNIFNPIMIDDYADGDTAHSGAKILNRCTALEKVEALFSRAEGDSVSTSGLFIGDKDGDTTAAIVAVGSLAVLMGLGGIFLLRKKRMLGR